MPRANAIGVVLLAVFAAGAGATATAQAVTAPFWSVDGTRLIAGKTHNITGRTVSRFRLSVPAAGVELSCTDDKLESGVLEGSEPGRPGKGSGRLALSECTVTGNGEPCKLAEPDVTNEITSKLVESIGNGPGGKGKQLLVYFAPAKGDIFSTVRFEGSGCRTKETSLVGSIAAEILTDSTAEEAIELGQAAKEAATWLERFPETPVSEVLLVNSEGETTVSEVGLSTFTDPVIETGVALGLLAGSKFEAEATKWSPLP